MINPLAPSPLLLMTATTDAFLQRPPLLSWMLFEKITTRDATSVRAFLVND